MSVHFACILRVKNEEKNLPRFFASHPFVDRFFVVDNGSEDGTTAILAALPNVEVIETKEPNAAKNLHSLLALARESGAKWVLWMEADMEWEQRAVDEFPKLLNDPLAGGWVFRIYPFVLSREFYRIDRDWAQFTMMGQLRLFRCHEGIYWSSPRPNAPGMPRGIKGAVKKSDLRIKHWTIEAEEELERKIAFYSRLQPERDYSHLRNDETAIFKRWIE